MARDPLVGKLCVQAGAVGGDDVEIGSRARLILGAGQLGRPRRTGARPTERLGLLREVTQARETVLDIGHGGEEGLAIGRERFIVGRMGA